MIRVLTLFGTRPEVIKLSPVIRALEADPATFQTLNVASGQHTDLLYPFAERFGVRLGEDLRVMEPGQGPNGVCARVLTALDDVLERESVDLVLVQGDTTTALAGALAAFHRKIPAGHVEAGLRSGNLMSPYPEEMNRTLVTRLASYHFAATPRNRETLLREGVDDARIFLTGNPVVDALKDVLARAALPAEAEKLLAETHGLKRIVLTTHRRESFGLAMAGNLRALRAFVEANDDVALIFPVHPNPHVVETTQAILSGHPRIRLVAPLGYEAFILLLAQAWLIVSDSGGVQEEAPTLGRPLLVLRENTERPEAVECGIARLVGGRPERLAEMLEEARRPGSWTEHARETLNPFGSGDSGARIAQAIARAMRPTAQPIPEEVS